MKDIIIIQDGENYHLFLGDTGVWLNQEEMHRLQVAVSHYYDALKKSETYEAGKYYRFECENEHAYIALLIEDDGKGTLRFGEHIEWNPKHGGVKSAKYYNNTSLVLSKRSCTVLDVADEDAMRLFGKCKLEAEKVKANRFKMYDKVLVRDYEDECWFPAIFVKYNKENGVPYHCLLIDTGGSSDFRFCEPYEGNESAVYDDKEILPF